MRKNKFLTAVCMLSAFVGSNLHAKTSKTKKIVKAKTSHKPLNNRKSHSAGNTGIYGIPSNNKSALIETKMTELRQRHAKVMASGSAHERKKVAVERKLLTSYKKWRGTKYAWGGDSKNGIDCSALTRRVYREVFSFELPRVTKDQIKVGRHVSRHNLKPGDILYFRPDGKYNHTAVYLGNSLFINASSSKGVILSSLEHSYWSKYFVHGVRVDTASANV